MYLANATPIPHQLTTERGTLTAGPRLTELDPGLLLTQDPDFLGHEPGVVEVITLGVQGVGPRGVVGLPLIDMVLMGQLHLWTLGPMLSLTLDEPSGAKIKEGGAVGSLGRRPGGSGNRPAGRGRTFLRGQGGGGVASRSSQGRSRPPSLDNIGHQNILRLNHLVVTLTLSP